MSPTRFSSSLSKYITNHDLFGHKIELNFNRKGSSHNTLIGGVVSVLIKVTIVFYIYLLTKKLINKEDDKNSSLITNLDLDALGPVRLDETKTNMYFVLSNTTSEHSPIDWNEA